MNCPICNKILRTITYEKQQVDLCAKCGGIWFDKGELLSVVNSLLNKNKVDPQTVKEVYKKTVISPDNIKQFTRECPKCNVDMDLYNYSYNSNVFLDKCLRCTGIWTDEGEMQSVAKYIKGNPTINDYAKLLVKEISKRQKSRVKSGKTIAVIISLIYLAVAYFFSGGEAFFRMLSFLVFPLGCIFFAEELGSVVGVRFRVTFFAPIITRPTPAAFVVFGGWVLLFLPPIMAITALITNRQL